jgi:ABC-type transporter MlaC component
MMVIIKINSFVGDISLKRAIVFVILTVFLVSVISSAASAAIFTTWVPSVNTTRISTASKSFSSVIEAVAKFEGTLQAYSVSGDQNVEEQVFFASDKISDSLAILNFELTNVYKDLSPEQQSALEDAYISLGSYLQKLAEEANQIFQDEDGKAKATFEVQEIGIIFENLPNQLWVGSAISV